MMFALLLLSAVSGHTLGSTLKPLQEMSMEDAVLSLGRQMSNMEEKFVEEGKKIQELSEEIKRVERNCFEDKNEISLKLEQVLNKLSEIEKSSREAIDDASNRMLVEKNKLLLMDNHLLFEVHQLQKKEREMFEKIVNIENEVSRDRVTKDLLQVRLNETTNMTRSCLESQVQIEDTMRKNIERLDNDQSNLSSRMGNVENSFEALRKDLDYVSDRKDAALKLTVQNNTNDIGQLKQELSRIQTICSPPCENGGQCVKNVCKCTPLFTGDRCQQVLAVCSPPCENGGQCRENNICNCTPLFTGHRCQDYQCGVDFDDGGNNGGGNNSSSLVWPWMAAVYLNRTSGIEHQCDGTIIHRYFVMTSAYCLNFYGDPVESVKLGLSDLKNGTHLQDYRVRSVHKHPHFKLGRFDYDFAYNIVLLEVEKPITFDLFVRPVCLPPQEILQDRPFYEPHSTAKAVKIRAYMQTISSSENSPQIMVNFTIQSPEECRREIERRRIGRSPQQLLFCAEGPSVCPVWGSPLMQFHRTGDGYRTWTQVGFIGYSPGCKIFVSPRLDHLRAWVDSTIAAASKQ